VPSLHRFYEHKNAVVTGAGSGIGQSIARLLGRNGVRVHCADIDGDAATAIAAELDGATAHTVDVTNAEAVADLAERVFAEDGRLDLLFNNAGIGHAGLVADTELDDWRQVMEINVMGVINGIHAFLPRMQQQGGNAHIINTASAAGLIALPRMAPYCASKHAVVGLSQSLAAELHGSPIKVTILCPGIINTAIVKKTRMRGEIESHQSQAVDYYETKGTSPDKVASDLLQDVRKGKLFCVSPRGEVGIGWLTQRISPQLTQMIARSQTARILGLK